MAMVMGKDDTENTLVPSILESVDDEDEILFTLAASLGKMKDCVHNVRLLLEPLERLAAVEETVVRDAAVKSVGQIADKLDAEGCSLACDMVLRLASADWFTGRCSACQLVPIVYNVAKHHDADKARFCRAHYPPSYPIFSAWLHRGHAVQRPPFIHFSSAVSTLTAPLCSRLCGPLSLPLSLAVCRLGRRGSSPRRSRSSAARARPRWCTGRRPPTSATSPRR